MNRNEFNERIQNEFEKFRITTLNLTNEEIFEKSFEINFKTEMTEYLQNDDKVDNLTSANLELIEGSILDELFEIYLSNDTDYTDEDLFEKIIEIYFNSFEQDEN